MNKSLSNRLAAVAAVFVLYLIGYFVVGADAFGSGTHYWATAMVAAVGLVLVVRGFLRGEPVMRQFFGALSIGFAALLLEMLTYQQGIFILDAHVPEPEKHAGALWMAFSTVFNFSWTCAWGLLVLQLLQRSTAARLINRLLLLLGLGIASIFALDYLGELLGGVGYAATRFSLVVSALQLSGVILGLTAVLLGVKFGYTMMVVGYGLMAASDFIFTRFELAGDLATLQALEPLFAFGLYVIVAGLLSLELREESPDGGAEPGHPALGIALRSGLSALLVTISMTAILAASYVEQLTGHDRDLLSFSYLLMSIVSVVALTRLAAGFDRAVQFSAEWSQRLMRDRLRSEPWVAEDAQTRRALEGSGLERVLESLQEGADWLQDEVLFLGPERLNRPPQGRAGDGVVQCFIVMPFGMPWSDAVADVIRRACQTLDVRPVRGDDLFAPTDILDDIWQGINAADFIVADITGRNPNVLYELGIAHTLAKPVLILSQSVDDIPFDLETRRVIRYAADDSGVVAAADTAGKSGAAAEAAVTAKPRGGPEEQAEGGAEGSAENGAEASAESGDGTDFGDDFEQKLTAAIREIGERYDFDTAGPPNAAGSGSPDEALGE